MVAQSPMIRVLYGLRNGTLVSACDADRGAACHCTCPGCGGALIARKGPRKRPHFAHAAGDETRGCGETALHFAAKSLLAKPGDFDLPGWEPPSWSEVERGLCNLRNGGAAVRSIRQHHSRPPRPIRIERAESEVSHDGGRWRTDVQAWVAGQRLQIEIRVHHATGEEKLAGLRANNLAALEVTLDPRDGALGDLAELEQAVRHRAARRWLTHPQRESAYTEALLRALPSATQAHKEWEGFRALALQHVDAFEAWLKVQSEIEWPVRSGFPRALHEALPGERALGMDPYLWKLAIWTAIRNSGKAGFDARALLELQPRPSAQVSPSFQWLLDARRWDKQHRKFAIPGLHAHEMRAIPTPQSLLGRFIRKLDEEGWIWRDIDQTVHINRARLEAFAGTR